MATIDALKGMFEVAQSCGDLRIENFLENIAVGMAAAEITSEHLQSLSDGAKALVYLAIIAEAAKKFYSH